MTKSVSALWLFLAYLAIALFVMREVLFAPGAVGLRNDWLIAPLPGETASYIGHLLTAWSDIGLGAANVRSGPTPFFMLISLASLFAGISAALLSKLIPLFAIAGAGFTAHVLIFSIVRRRGAAFIGSLIYLFSPLLFNVVVAGYLHFMVSYALLPLVIVTFRRALTAQTPRPWIIVSGVLFALLQDNVQVASMLIIVPLWWLVVGGSSHQLTRIKRGFIRAAMIGVVATLIQAPFVLPAVMQFQDFRTVTQQVVQFSWSRLSSPDLVNAFTLDGAGYRYFTAALPPQLKPLLTAGHIAIFALALSALIWRRYRHHALLWNTVALFSLFLFKGVNPPFGAINQWLLDHVFLMAALRNVQYVTMLTSLALAVLVGIWLASFSDSVRSLRRGSQLSYGLYGLLGILLLALAIPYFDGKFNGEVQTYSLHPDYTALVEAARREVRDGRWLLLPPAQPMRGGANTFAGLDPLGRRLPSVIGYEIAQPWERLLTMLLYAAAPIRPEQLLCDGAVHTVLARNDFTSETPRFSWEEFPRATWTNEQLHHAIASWQSLTKRDQLADGQATRYTVSQPCDRLITAAQATLSSGTLSDAVDVGDANPAEVPPRPVLYAAQQTPGVLTRLPREAIGRTVVAQNNLLDLTRLFLLNAVEIPITNLTRDAKEGWSPLTGWWWKDWHYAAVLDPLSVVATGDQTGHGAFTIKEPGPAEVWVKAMHTRLGSTLTVWVDDTPIGTITTQAPLLQGLVWTRLKLEHLTPGTHTVTIRSNGGENLIARLLLVAANDAARAQQATDQWLAARDIVLALTLATRNLAAYPGVFGAQPVGHAHESGVFSLTVPRDGSYAVSVKAATSRYVSAIEQLESDYLDTIFQGRRIGQTFELAPGVGVLHSLKFKLEARHASSNTPTSTPPDAPLTMTIYRVDGNGETKEVVASATVSPEVAPVNDAWSLVEVPIDISLDGQGGRFLAELTSPATQIGWAIATVSDGFGNKPDYYSAGAMIVNGESQQRDVTFMVLTQVGSPQAAGIEIDTTTLPLSLTETKESWHEVGTIELLAGSHSVTLPVTNPHVRIDQIILRSVGASQPRAASPAITYRRTRPTSLHTVKPLGRGAPYWLILKDAWHDGWQSSPPSDHHLVMNGFANTWWIEPPSESYDVAVWYTPQRYTDAGLIISGTTLLGIIGWFSWRHRSKLAGLWQRRRFGFVVAASLAVALLIVSSLLALTGNMKGAERAAIVGIASFVVGILAHVLQRNKVSARMQGILIILVLFALLGWRIASQLDQPAARSATQPPVVTISP